MPEYESSRDRRVAKGLLPRKYITRRADTDIAAASKKDEYQIPQDYREGIGLLRSIDDQVMKAVYGDDAAELKKLIKSGADLNQRDSYGYTPVMLAVKLRNLDALKVLLDNDADPNAKSTAGNTGLSLAAGIDMAIDSSVANPVSLERSLSYSYLEAAKCLLNAGADKNTRIGELGATVLMVAIQHRRWVIAAELIKRGADVNLQTEDGMTALHFAVLVGDPHGINLLLESPSVRVSTKDKIGIAALDLAERLGQASTAEAIRNRSALNKADTFAEHKRRMEEHAQDLKDIDEEMEKALGIKKVRR